MIEIYVKELNSTWFGLASSRDEIAATAVGPDKRRTIENLLRSLPPNAKFEIADRLSEFAERTILTLESLHFGREEPGDFVLSKEYISEPRATILRVASRIPPGYVASYGDIAKLASTDPRTVGHAMATNTLYPIVPCHRVVGTDFSLVGYDGGKSLPALKAKLSRLVAECKGFKSTKHIPVNGGVLKVHPVEQAVEKARKRGLISSPPKQSHLNIY